jgi:hypothetical protein
MTSAVCLVGTAQCQQLFYASVVGLLLTPCTPNNGCTEEFGAGEDDMAFVTDYERTSVDIANDVVTLPPLTTVSICGSAW